MSGQYRCESFRPCPTAQCEWAWHCHPEDELCQAGPGVIDPQLCALLAEMDRTEGAVVQDELLIVFEAERGFMANLTLCCSCGARSYCRAAWIIFSSLLRYFWPLKLYARSSG